MMTQTHILIGAALFARPRRIGITVAAIAGGIIPDIAIFVMYGIEKSKGTAESAIWNEVYWQPFWQDVVATGNSIPFYLGLLVATIGWQRIRRREKRDHDELETSAEPSRRGAQLGSCGVVFALACLVHMACDFPLHNDDAHRHLFPLSNFKFYSPVSYWDPKHFGLIAMTIECCLGIYLAWKLMRRFKHLAAKLAWAALALPYFAAIAFIGWYAINRGF